MNENFQDQVPLGQNFVSFWPQAYKRVTVRNVHFFSQLSCRPLIGGDVERHNQKATHQWAGGGGENWQSER